MGWVSAAFLVMAAFLAELVSFSSPCCLPLLPGYVAYVGGDPRQASPRRTMAAAGLFTLGFGATFTALGVSASWLGATLLGNRPVLVQAAGLLVAAMGVATMLGAGIPGLAGERRLVALHRVPRGPGFAAPLGAAFALGWTPLYRPGACRAADHRRRQPHRCGRRGPVGRVCRRSGRPLPAAGVGGRPLVLNVWASWCVPCRKEMPPPDRRSGVPGVRWVREDRHPALAPLAVGVLAVVGLPPVDLHGPLHYLGVIDPLCGMTRGTVAVLRGQLGRAFTYNPASPLLVAGAALLLGRWVVGRLSGRWLEVRVQPSRVVWGVGAVTVLVLWVNQQAHAALLR